jgi:hypothetical protein
VGRKLTLSHRFSKFNLGQLLVAKLIHSSLNLMMRSTFSKKFQKRSSNGLLSLDQPTLITW